MSVTILFSAPPARWDDYRDPLSRALSDDGIEADLATDHPPGTVDYIVYAPNGGLTDFGPYVRTKAVLSLWAGVETIAPNPTLTMPLTRMVDDGLRQGMVEYVAAHVLRHHIGLDAHVVNPDRLWEPAVPPLAQDRRVSLLGLGELGSSAARALAGLGFDVTGWSRSPREVEGIRCLSGAEGLVKALEGAEIVVLLLPLTAGTENVLDAAALERLAPGACIVNPGRGALIDDAALLSALDSGRVGHATLDVFREEPLPGDHPFWTHPGVTVTPHIASETRADTAADRQNAAARELP